MPKKKKILFVCLGNICRSPLAEGLMKQKISEQQLEDIFEVDSCGTGNWHIGDLPDPRTRKNAELNGLILTSRCRQIVPADLEDFDHIIAMDQSNVHNILKLSGAKQHQHKIELLRAYDEQATTDEVPDPYHGGPDDFQEVFDIVNKCTELWLKKNAR